MRLVFEQLSIAVSDDLGFCMAICFSLECRCEFVICRTVIRVLFCLCLRGISETRSDDRHAPAIDCVCFDVCDNRCEIRMSNSGICWDEHLRGHPVLDFIEASSTCVSHVLFRNCILSFSVDMFTSVNSGSR